MEISSFCQPKLRHTKAAQNTQLREKKCNNNKTRINSYFSRAGLHVIYSFIFVVEVTSYRANKLLKQIALFNRFLAIDLYAYILHMLKYLCIFHMHLCAYFSWERQGDGMAAERDWERESQHDTNK